MPGTQRKDELLVAPGRLDVGDGADRLEITAITGISLERVVPGGVKAVVVEYGDHQLVAFNTSSGRGGLFGGNRKLMEAIQRAFGLN